jgi:hypothetical protein
MFIGWSTCIPAVLLPHSLCRFTAANAPANRQMPIVSVVRGICKKKEKDMKYNSKIIIAISGFCVLTGVLLVFLYSLTDPATRFRQKRTELYKKEYKAILDSCKKWNGTIYGKVDPTCLVNEDTNYIYLAILIEKYRAVDRIHLRYPNFGDIFGDSLWTGIQAQDDAEYDYLKSKYGKDFRNTVRILSRELNERYRIHYYDSILGGLTQKAYKKSITKDNVQIGEFNKTFLDTVPFIIKVDTSFSKGWFEFEETKDKIIFRATQESYDEPKKFLLPEISIYYYFDSEKTDLLYSKYAFRKVVLTNK